MLFTHRNGSDDYLDSRCGRRNSAKLRLEIDWDCSVSAVQPSLADSASKFGFIAEYTIHPVIEMDQAAQSLQQGADFRESISSTAPRRDRSSACRVRFDCAG